MGFAGDEQRPSGRAVFEACLSGAQERPLIPRLRSDNVRYGVLPHSLEEFRQAEGYEAREKRLHDLWKKIKHRGFHLHPTDLPGKHIHLHEHGSLTTERAKRLEEAYEFELVQKCGEENHNGSRALHWREFKRYAEAKEAELWSIFHDELDLDRNGHLDAEELYLALGKAGIYLTPATLSDFMTALSSTPHSHAISFAEFRDFLLLLPRKASTEEIFRYYQVRKFMGDDGRGAARVTMEGDVSLSGEDRPPTRPLHPIPHRPRTSGHGQQTLVDFSDDDDDDDDDDDADPYYEYDEYDEMEEETSDQNNTSFKFLLAGGIAGAVSRTATAPFDRLKIFLITRSPEVIQLNMTNATDASKAAGKGAKAIGNAVFRIYLESGVRGFWIGNGLSVAKIFPESAIKFFSYETAKRFFARYVDEVDDSREISGTSRFISGGIGGIASQLSIYPIETLKTQMMSSTGEQRANLFTAAKRLYGMGGIRAYYRGLVVGLIGVFPYAAIDMSTFEALKLTYLKSTGKEEPGVLPLLAFGSVSGGVGATSVYPMNLVRTRLQASGSPGHPQKYTGIPDVILKTYQREGWRGFYRGLFPTLAKVIPSVSISYVVYENSKKRLGV